MYPDEKVKSKLRQLGLKETTIDYIFSLYIGHSDRYKEGFCSTIDALLQKQDRSPAILYGLVMLCELSAEVMNYGNKDTVYFFELLSSDFSDDERYEICDRMVKLLELIKNPNNLQDVLSNIIQFGSVGLYNNMELATSKMCAAMFNQLNDLYEYIRHVFEQYKASGEIIESIKLTGSDGHMRGKQVLLIEKKESGTIVLKPRSVEPEKVLGKVISAFNTYFSEQNIRIQLPNPWITEKGEMEYLTKKTEFTKEEAENYYRQMGVLICIAELLGMTDLHQDNIMATAQGPVIIDAECVLDPWTMYDGSFRATCLNMAFSDWSGDGREIAEAAFYIVDGDTTIESTRAFRQYASQICTGISAGLQAYSALGEDLLIIQKVTESLTQIRWVPIATKTFYEAGIMYYASVNEETQDYWWQLLSDKLETYISTKILPEMSIEIDKEKLKKVFMSSFDHKDIPYFKLKYDGGGMIQKSVEIYCDEVLVGRIVGLSAEWLKEYALKPWLQLQLSYIPSRFWLETLEFLGSKK